MTIPTGAIGFGAMRLADADIWHGPADRPAAVKLLRRVAELGVPLIDTADVYALGDNEALIAEALHPYPDGLLIATKAGETRPSPGEWVPVGNPAYLKQQAELSLRRLRVDHIPLFYLHRIDPLVALEDQLGALVELREAGKIGTIGLSEVSVEQLDAALRITAIGAVQNAYNVGDRTHEAVLDRTTELGIAFVPFYPVAASNTVVKEVAGELGATPAQVSLAWLLRRAPNMLPIPGTTSEAHLAENLAAADLELGDERFDRLQAFAGG
ncbi:aldo/keto reductase [Herbidospora mongoliensis]|uniref:aldo/keto reductase n=1 Tax=Herbidospora mongoliensis TaxID=688067 RepID=UPI00082E727B|nr:aldo/keto reductase [Herbidospora mongoliensis]